MHMTGYIKKKTHHTANRICFSVLSSHLLSFLYLSQFLCLLQKDELDDIPIELSKVQSVKVSRIIIYCNNGSNTVIEPQKLAHKTLWFTLLHIISIISVVPGLMTATLYISSSQTQIPWAGLTSNCILRRKARLHPKNDSSISHQTTHLFVWVLHLLLHLFLIVSIFHRWSPRSGVIAACLGPLRSSQTARRMCWKLRMRNIPRSGCSASTWPWLRPERGRTERLPPTCETNTCN